MLKDLKRREFLRLAGGVVVAGPFVLSGCSQLVERDLQNRPVEGDISALAVNNPVISSIGGVTNKDSGINNGRVAMPCGHVYDGLLVLNDQLGTYPWTIRGSNFGSTKGSVQIGSQNAVIKSWSPSIIVADGTLPWNSGLTTIQVAVITSGGKNSLSIGVVPAIRSRIYGQCTWWVARRRLEMGLQPSLGSWSSNVTLDGSYIPQRGDQYVFTTSFGKHTAIAESVSGGNPVAITGGTRRSWTVNLSQYNASCTNKQGSFSATFQVDTVSGKKSVTQGIKFSASSQPAIGCYR